MLLRNVGFGRVRGDAYRLRAGGMRRVQIFDRADARQQQHGHFRALHAANRGLEPFKVAMRAEPVVEARSGETVAVGDFDGIDAGTVECGRDDFHLSHGILVTDRMHAVAQRHVLNVERLAAHE